MQGGDDGRSQLDFGAVQRGDAEMEQKMNRLLRACIESLPDATPDANPICSIHDQGAGGNGNVLKVHCVFCSKKNGVTPFQQLKQKDLIPDGIDGSK